MQINTLAGQLLLAMPSLDDPNFNGSVVLICHHDEDGCMGLIINQPQDLMLADVLEDLDLEMTPQARREAAVRRVFTGGPVDNHRGFVLHDGWHIYDSTMQVSDELHLTASRDILEALARGDGPEHYLMILGYAGWHAGQLEQELADNDWLVAPVSQHIVFHEPPESRWDFGARCMGFERSHLSSQVGHA